MKSHWRVSFLALCVFSASGCATVPDNVPPANVAGTWTGSFIVKGWGSGEMPMVLTLEQAGRRVTGDVQTIGGSVGAGCSARFQGTVAGDSLSLLPLGCGTMYLTVRGDEMVGEFPNRFGTMTGVTLRRGK